jgi:hypothetical protein
MIKRIGICIVLCALGPVARADFSLTIGRAISQFDDVDIEMKPEEVCPPEAICLRSWSRWTLSIKSTISGPVVNGRTHVVMMQHAPVVDSTFKKDMFFVLEYIDDAAERKRLHADYKLLDMTAPELMICTSIDPTQLGVSADDIYRQGDGDDVTFCFRDPRSTRDQHGSRKLLERPREGGSANVILWRARRSAQPLGGRNGVPA